MAASAPEKQQIDIDPEGDLILKVGGKDETQSEQNDNNGEDGATREDRGNDTTASLRLLRVCSKIMTLSSPVFKSMLEPGRFLEGSLALNKAHPPHLALPDDEPVAMTMLCRIIHYKQEPQDPTVFESLSGLAVLSDKYGCVSAIQPWFTYCLHQKLSNPSGIDIDDLPHLLSAAHFFDDCSAFYGLTMTAVRFLPRNTEMREAFEAALYPGIAGKLTGATQPKVCLQDPC